MFCNQCGKEVPDTVKKCPNCGADLEEVKQSNQKSDDISAKITGLLSGIDLHKFDFSKIPLKPLAAIVVGIILIVIVVKAFSNRKPTLKLNDYVSVVYEGYDSVGTARVEIDYDKFGEDYGKKIKFTSNAKKELKNMEDIEGIDVSELTEYEGEQLAAFIFQYVLIGALDKSDHLSNGDVIKYVWDFDEEMVTSAVRCNLKYSDIKFKVDGLEKVDSFDPFEGIEMEFNGVEPDGKASFTNSSTDPIVRNISFSMDKSSGLSNGDKVTLKIYDDYYDTPNDYYISTFGKIPTQTEKVYEVSGLGKYVSAISEIPEELMDRMKKQAVDSYMAGAAEWNNDDQSSEETRKIRSSKVESFNYIGRYLLTRKSSDNIWGGYHNMLTLVYKPVVTIERIIGDEEYYKNEVYYWDITYHDILIDQEGKAVMDLNSYDKCTNSFGRDTGISWSGYDAYYLSGYEHIDDVYRDVVSKNLEQFNHEDNITDINESELLKDIKPRETRDQENDPSAQEQQDDVQMDSGEVQ